MPNISLFLGMNSFLIVGFSYVSCIGIFAGDESDGESERPGFGQKTGGKFRSGFSGGGGVSFVSAGIQQPASKEDKGEAKDKKDEDAEPDIPVTDSSRYVFLNLGSKFLLKL